MPLKGTSGGDVPAARPCLADRTQAAIFGLRQRLVPLDEALED
jgi:hypothetical protein